MATGWPHCKIYLKTITRGACVFLKEMGNRVNEVFTSTTVIEKMRALDQVQIGWTAFRDSKGKGAWTWESLGQK
eukprot:2776224-Pyramimonas_sp.AAC.1